MDGDHDGSTYEHRYDFARLNRQGRLVAAVMADGRWHTLNEIAHTLRQQGTMVSEASVSARLRDMRKARFGGFQIERRRTDNKALHAYRLNGHMPVLAVVPEPTKTDAADGELQRRLDLVLAMCDAADQAHTPHVRAASVRGAADGTLT